MWIPKTEEELVAVVNERALEESSTFDAKREIPTKNVDTAKDIAAMANDGGVIIYGIGEDDNGHLTELNPILLEGLPERIDAIVSSSIQERPEIIISKIPSSEDQSKGYLIVEVPPSERAPHMVVAQKNHRYYGRSAKGNVPLSEGEVARLYERRRQWEVDREALLAKEIENAPLLPNSNFAYLHLIARPVCKSDGLLEQFGNDNAIRQLLQQIVRRSLNPNVFPQTGVSPEFFAPLPRNWIMLSHGYCGRLDHRDKPNGTPDPGHTLYLRIDFDGSGHLFCGRAAERRNDQLLFFSDLVAEHTTRDPIGLGASVLGWF